MTDLSLVILYVEDPARSAKLYSEVLGAPVVEQSETFAMLPLGEGVRLGLWRRDGVQPKADAAAGGSEVDFIVPDTGAVRAAHADWKRRGLRIAQEPTRMDFGFTFLGLDPDGHRIRVFARE